MSKENNVNRKPVVHPYARVSDPNQIKGGGLDRQSSSKIQEFAKQYGFAVSSRILVDDGVSAFKGLNATPDHELGRFLLDARQKIIRPGDCLLIENYDRLSRQNPWASIALVGELRSLGIHVGRMDRMKILRADDDDTGEFFEAALEFMRGHSESAMKSYRHAANWKRKREKALSEGKLLTRKVPSWIKVVGESMEIDTRKAETIRLLFNLAGQGFGTRQLVRKLHEMGIPPIGSAAHWARPTIYRYLTDRRVLGEFQPRLDNGEPAGPVIKNYFPPIIDESTFYRASRRNDRSSGRRPAREQHSDIFSGLIRDARGTGNYRVITRKDRDRIYRVLINQGAENAHEKGYSFDYVAFQNAFLSLFKELSAQEILSTVKQPDKTEQLGAQLSALEGEEIELGKELRKGNVAQIAQALRQVLAEKEAIVSQLAEERERARHPLSESWGEAQSLAEALQNSTTPEDTRIRLRTALSRVVESIHILVVPRGRKRFCAVQVRFHGSKLQRSYLIFFWQGAPHASNKKPAQWWTRSFSDIGMKREIDLRDARHVSEMETLLNEIELPKGRDEYGKETTGS